MHRFGDMLGVIVWGRDAMRWSIFRGRPSENDRYVVEYGEPLHVEYFDVEGADAENGENNVDANGGESDGSPSVSHRRRFTRTGAR